MSNLFKWAFHGIVGAAIFGIPLILQIHPAWIDLTVGGLLNSLYAYLISTQTTIGFSKR